MTKERATALQQQANSREDDDLQALMDAIELSPEHEIAIDLEARTVTSRAGVHRAGIPDSRTAYTDTHSLLL